MLRVCSWAAGWLEAAEVADWATWVLGVATRVVEARRLTKLLRVAKCAGGSFGWGNPMTVAGGFVMLWKSLKLATKLLPTPPLPL